MKAKSIPLIGLILLFTSLFAGCDKVASSVTGFFASPTPFPTSTPTSTPTATATPLPPLTLLPCPAPDSCTQGSVVSDFIASTVKPGGVYSVDIPVGSSIAFHAAWIAQNEFILQQNFESITPFFAIDGQSAYFPYLLGYEPYVDKDGSEYYSAWVGAVVSGWQVGQTRRIRMGFTVNDTITTGWQIYSAGDVVEYTYIINPVSSAVATLAAVSPSATGVTPASDVTLTSTLPATATPTPKPTVTLTLIPTASPTRLNRPTALPTPGPGTPTLACSADSTILISNNTGGPITFFLSGPASFIFKVQTGNQTIYVCPGTYTYSAYACNGSYMTGKLTSGAQYDFRCQ